MRYFPALVLSAILGGSTTAELPSADARTGPLRNPNTPRVFGSYTNLNAWNQRAADIRSQILTSAGLVPLPARTPLEARVFGRVAGDGFTVEKVQLQTSPGVYLAGNLYRPLSPSAGPFPAALCPHGHWPGGRLEQTEAVHMPARCMQLARLGFVVFSPDLIGYQDTLQFVPRSTEAASDPYAGHAAVFRDPALQLWNLNLLGQQLWNGIRSLDFLSDLDGVDPDRIGCTAADSGALLGFLLSAVDLRVKVLSPVCMISHTHQGDCPCENAPGLRIIGDNVEFAAAFAPRPQLLVGASGDWTRTTLSVEGPEIHRIYGLMNASNRFRALSLEGPHNDHAGSRALAAGWLARWLLNRSETADIPDMPDAIPPAALLRVYPDNLPPPGALNEAQFVQQWIRQRQADLAAALPTNRVAFTNHLRSFVPYWARVLAIESGDRPALRIEGAIGRAGRGDRVERRLLLPDGDQFSAAVVLVHPDGRAAIGRDGERASLAARLLEARIPVLAFDAFQTGPSKDPTLPHYTPLDGSFSTYHRTLVQERVQDILNAVAYVRQVVRPRRVILVGDGAAGLWTLLAARAADGVVADAGALNWDDDRQFLGAETFVPGIRLIGGPDGAASLAAPRPLWIHHTGSRFRTPITEKLYSAAEAPDQLTVSPEVASETALLHWILGRSHP